MENELRLGNLFILRGKIVEFDDKLMHSVIYGGLEGSKPIPLTEEWLLKLGFVNNKHLDENIFSNVKFNIAYDLSDLTTKISESWEFGSHIKYVHQLQNLYFALTKEELTMK